MVVVLTCLFPATKAVLRACSRQLSGRSCIADFRAGSQFFGITSSVLSACFFSSRLCWLRSCLLFALGKNRRPVLLVFPVLPLIQLTPPLLVFWVRSVLLHVFEERLRMLALLLSGSSSRLTLSHDVPFLTKGGCG